MAPCNDALSAVFRMILPILITISIIFIIEENWPEAKKYIAWISLGFGVVVLVLMVLNTWFGIGGNGYTV